jgi:hypothetical protein
MTMTPANPVCAWNDRADIDRVVSELVNDAHTILAVLDGADLDDAQAEAVGLLALVAGQTSNMAMRMGRGGSRR